MKMVAHERELRNGWSAALLAVLFLWPQSVQLVLGRTKDSQRAEVGA